MPGTNQCSGVSTGSNTWCRYVKPQLLVECTVPIVVFLSSDVDECELAEANDCQQDCTNTVGSFNCSCQEGFTLNTDGRNCDGIR